MKIPENVEYIIKKLEESGYEAFIITIKGEKI